MIIETLIQLFLLAAGALLLIGLVVVGPLIRERLTDGIAIGALAKLSCPKCNTLIGTARAEEAAERITRENSGISMVNGGYTPAAFHLRWPVTCPACGASLRFSPARRDVRLAGGETRTPPP